MSKYCQKNSADRLAQHRVATNLQSVKNAIPVKHNKESKVSIEKKKVKSQKGVPYGEKTLHSGYV